MLWLLRLAICTLLAASGLARAQAVDYRLDPVHTRVLFLVDHAGLSRAIGTFSGAQGELSFDPRDWSSARLQVRLPLASLDLGDADWRKRVLDRTFLHAGRQPEASFTSTRVEPGADGGARVFGQLSLRGISREVALDVRLNALKRHPLTLRRSAGFSATGRISRSEFGMTAWKNLVGDEVELMIEVEAVRSGGGNDSDTDKPDPGAQPDTTTEPEHADTQ